MKNEKLTFGDLPGHEFHGNQWAQAGVPADTHAKLTGAGFQAYGHGQGHQGYLDKGESKLTVKELDKHLRSQGYRTGHFNQGGQPIVATKMYDGNLHWGYEHPHAGPYANRTASITSTKGTHVRNVEFHNHVIHNSRSDRNVVRVFRK